MGVFATRSPFRPNSLGLSCVRLLEVEQTTNFGTVLHVGGADLISVTYSFVTGASTGGAYAPAYIVCGLIFFVVCFPLSTLAARWEASLKERKGRVNTSLKTAAKKVELKEAA